LAEYTAVGIDEEDPWTVGFSHVISMSPLLRPVSTVEELS
jgi:hypothetical protein